MIQRHNQIAALWEWFTLNAVHFRDPQTPKEAAIAELSEKLHAIEPGLVFEFTVHDGAADELVISADGIRDLFPIVLEVVGAAPQLPGWRILPFRQPGNIDASIEMNGHHLGPDDIWFIVEPEREGNRLTLFVRGLSERNRDEVTGAVFVLLDNALGEYIVETGLSSVNVEPLPTSKQHLRPFVDLPQCVKRNPH